MKIEELKKEIETKNKIYRGICHDCGKPVEVRVTVNGGQIEISGGALYRVKQQYNEVEMFFKCDVCFAEDRILHNWKKTEVYSRAVGYLRPVNQYNKGKKEEFKMRKEFVNIEGKWKQKLNKPL